MIEKILQDFKNAICCEDIFGDIKDIKELRRKYHSYAKYHPDLHKAKEDKIICNEIFVILNNFYNNAIEKINKKTYGNKTPLKEIKIINGKSEYTILDLFALGDISFIYNAKIDKKDCRVKISKEAGNNDLLQNEAVNIKSIIEHADKDEKILQHFPILIDSFSIVDNKEKKQVNVFKSENDLISLKEIIEAYPEGIDPRDAAWMFNRMLTILTFIHSKNIIHGAITPSHILLNIETHNAKLVDWSYSLKENEKLKAISPFYKNYYPQEIFVKKPANTGLDIYMLANCFGRLLGCTFDGNKLVFKKDIPIAIKNLISSCILGYTHRSKSAKEIANDFKIILENLYGPRKFRVFVMPK